MSSQSRRAFIGDVGRGMLIAGVGAATACDMGLARAEAFDGEQPLRFGADERLVALLQETPTDKVLTAVVGLIRSGTTLKQITAAAALANARAFGGEDYIGFHTLMALGPALEMAKELPAAQAALPVLKVVYRNSSNLQNTGGCTHSAMTEVAPIDPPKRPGGEALRDAVRSRDKRIAEGEFAAIAKQSAEAAFDHLLYAVEDDAEVHRIVLAHRAWELLDLVGRERAHTMLRQSVRYCVKSETQRKHPEQNPVRSVLPQVMDKFRLHDRSKDGKPVSDEWVRSMMRDVLSSTPEGAAQAVGAALAAGVGVAAVGEALALASNQIPLRDDGRPKEWTSPGKPVGSVHGDSIGLHSCDSTLAWRGIARVASPRHAMACMVLAGYQIALDANNRRGLTSWEAFPRKEHLARVDATIDPKTVADLLHDAIRARDQGRAAAIVHRYGEAGYGAETIVDVLRSYAVTQDGALHAEKFYRTATSEFAAIRPAFRWRQLVALARVSASAFGTAAPGLEEAKRLLAATTA